MTSSSRWVPQTQRDLSGTGTHRPLHFGDKFQSLGSTNTTEMLAAGTYHQGVYTKSNRDVIHGHNHWTSSCLRRVTFQRVNEAADMSRMRRRCKLSSPAEPDTEGLITCVATCVCEGYDSKKRDHSHAKEV